MIASYPAVEPLIEELKDVLDLEIALLDRKRAILARMFELILSRDESAMERLLAELERLQNEQEAADVRMRSVRAALAQYFQCRPLELRLSSLGKYLPAEQMLAIEYRRQQILQHADKVRRQHLQTASLLHECARINRMLLESFLPQSQPLTTYTADGACRWQVQAGLMDTEL